MVTCSKLSLLLVKGNGPGGFGVGAFTYMDTLIGEIVTGESADQFSGNRHTERGQDLEHVASGLYSIETDNKIKTVGIILNHGIGYSPDGLVGNKGLIEIKTKLPNKLIPVILKDVVPAEHTAQCQGGLWVSERDWIDFICYWPGMPLFIKRAYRDEKLIHKISERVSAFHDLMSERLEKIMKSA